MNPSRNSPVHLLRRVFLAALMLQMNAHAEGEPVKKANLNQLKKVAASEFTKIVDHSFSPNKLLAVAVGSLDGGKPDWDKITRDNGSSFVLDDAHTRDNCGNYIIDVATDRVIGILDSSHFGTGTRYNNESGLFAWSGDSRWLVEIQSWRMHSAVCTVHRLNEKGRLIARLDFKGTAERIVSDRLRAKSPNLSPEKSDKYWITLSSPSISNDGTLTAHLTAQQPREGEHMDLFVVAKVEQTKSGDLSCKVTKVDVAKEEDGK